MYCDRTSVNQISKRLRYKSKHTRLQTEVCGYTNKIFTFGSSLRGFRRQSVRWLTLPFGARDAARGFV
jgi:hypothetical protein